MIPWYAWLMVAAVALLGCVVNNTNVLLLLSALVTAAMAVPNSMGIESPVWLEMLVFFATLGLCLIYVVVPSSGSDNLSNPNTQ